MSDARGLLSSVKPSEVLTRPRALFFFFGCFMGLTDGCHVRAMQTLDLMLSSGLDVVIYSYRWHPGWPWTAADEEACRRRFPGVQLVLDDGGPLMNWLAPAKRRISLLGDGARNWVLQQRLPRVTPQLDRLLAGQKFDLAVISYAEGLTRMNGLPDAKIIIDTHDVTALERVHDRPLGNLDLGSLRALRSEMGLLGMADVVWSISYSEYWVLREMLSGVEVRFVPPSVETRAPLPLTAPEYDLLFVGSDNRWNVAALPAFLEDFAKWGQRYTLAVAGKVCGNANVQAKAAGLPNVTLLGYQSDLAGLYARSRGAICPVEGTGTKIKLVEALCFGRPVFAAPGALMGLLPGYEGCVFPLDEASVSAVLNNEARLAQVQAASAQYASAYSHQAVLQRVEPDFRSAKARVRRAVAA